MSESQSVPVVGESQSVPVVGDSFVTIIIMAHGADLREDRTTPEQHDTLRKLTIAGKSGHITCVARDVIDTMFHLAHQLAKFKDLPFTDKLKFMITELKKYKFGERLQDMYNTSSKDDWKSLVPTADDWFSLTNVSYNHEYHFLVKNMLNPWEIKDFGIWLVDGSPHVLQRFKDVPIIPPDSLLYYNIMASIGLPQWPDKRGTVTTLFDVADRIKATYGVKYVNFVDASCRFVYNPIADAEADDVPMSEIASISIQRSEQPPDMDSGEMSPDFPGTSADKQPKQPSGICVATLEGHREAVASVAFHPFHPTGRLLATGSWDKTAKLWRLLSEGRSSCMATLKGHSNGVNSVAFNSTGTILATGSRDTTAKLWRLSPDNSSATCIATLEGHTHVVSSVAFNSTGFLATGSADRTVKLWNTKGCMATLMGHSKGVDSVAFHPTGTLLATGSSDNDAKLWDIGELWNKIKEENRAPGASGYMVRCYSEIDPPKMFGMPQTPPQGWIYVKGKPFGAKPFGKTPQYSEYYMNDEGTIINPHFPGPYRAGPVPYRAGSKKSSKKNKKKTKCLLIKIKKRQKNKSVKMK